MWNWSWKKQKKAFDSGCLIRQDVIGLKLRGQGAYETIEEE
jgi:hypothetical protein